MSRKQSHGFSAALAAVTGVLLAPGLRAHGGDDIVIRHVANNGIDSTTCGSRAHPCRSIGRAIQQANDGEMILVRPGRYGDLNGDGDFSDPGDELMDTTSFPGPCLVCVNKSVKLYSTHGAELTVIDGASTESFGPVVAGVAIHASGVSFGVEGHGFTVRSASNVGVLVQPPAGNIRIEGNHSVDNGIPGDSASGMGIQVWVSPGNVRVRKNVASDNNLYGFFVASGNPGNTGVARVTENTAKGNQSFGFVIDGSTGPAYTVLGNVAVSNAAGFSIRGIGHLVRQNVATGNRPGDGFFLSGQNLRVIRNTIVGNQAAGIFLGLDVTGPMNINRNNIYGNMGIGSSSEPNCGITNQSEQRIDARNNFWGLPSGPGPDPADAAGRASGATGSQCDTQTGAETLVDPFARQPFPITWDWKQTD